MLAGGLFSEIRLDYYAHSAIDYMLSSNFEKIVAFNILDIDINLSDHLPIMVICKYDIRASPSSCTSGGTMPLCSYITNIPDH